VRPGSREARLRPRLLPAVTRSASLKKMSCGIVVALAVAGAGCGSPNAEDFAGLYKGTGSTRFVDGAGGDAVDPHDEWTTSLTASIQDDKKLLFAGTCGLTADVVDEQTFTVNRNSCDLGREACHFVDRTLAGEGTLSEDRLTLSLVFTGEWVQSECVDAANNGVWSYRTLVTLKRQ